MTHLPYVAAAYALAVLLPVAFGIAAWRRATQASRRLAAIDPRERRGGSA